MSESGGATSGAGPTPASEDLSPSPWAGDVLNVGSLVLFAWCFYDALGYWNVTVDDAFITMKYAWQVTHGNGLVFNVGERVEGFSNPTWTAVMVIPHLLGQDAMVFGKYAGITSHALAAVLALRLGWRLSGARGVPAALAALAGAGLYAVSTPANWWAANNLETSFYGLLLVAAGWRWSVERTRERALPLSAFFAGLAGISRPEAPLLALALAAVAAVDLWRRGARRRLVEWAAAFALAPGSWVVVRLVYYGGLLPNTYYVKGRGSTVDMVIDYLRPWFSTETAFAVAALVGLVLLRLADRRRVWVLAGMLLAQCVFLAGMGVDWMLNQRFLVPILPLLAAAAGAGFGAWTERRPFTGPLSWLPAVFLLGVTGWQGARSVPTNIAMLDNKGQLSTVARDPQLDWPPGSLDRTFAGSNSEVTTWALARIPPQASVAYSEVGLIGYTTDWFILDLAGLTDIDIGGKTGLSHEEKVESIHRRAPDWLILRDGPAFHLILTRKAAWLRDEYELELGPKGLWVARRRDAPRATDAEIVANFAQAVERVPRFLPLHEGRIQWTLAAGTPEQRAAACADFERAFPKVTDVRDKCLAGVKSGGPRPSNAPVPIPAEQMAKALAATLPGTSAARTEDPFAEPGANGVGKGWMTVPASLARGRVRLAEGALRLDGGDSPALACEAEATLLSGTRRVRGQWKVEGLARVEDAEVTVRLLDANDEPVGEPLVLARPSTTTQDWTFIDRAVDAPAGAAQARICVSVGGAGSASVKGLAFTR